MPYKLLPNARVLMSTDGAKKLFIDTGSEVIPVQERLVDTQIRKIALDGSLEGKEVYENVFNGVTLIKLLDECLDVSSIVSVTVRWPGDTSHEDTIEHYYDVAPQSYAPGVTCLHGINSANQHPIAPSAIVIVENPAAEVPIGTYTAVSLCLLTEVSYEHVVKLDNKYVAGVPTIDLAGIEVSEENPMVPIPEPAAYDTRNAFNLGAPMIMLRIFIEDGVTVMPLYLTISEGIQGYINMAEHIALMVLDEGVLIMSLAYTSEE